MEPNPSVSSRRRVAFSPDSSFTSCIQGQTQSPLVHELTVEPTLNPLFLFNKILFRMKLFPDRYFPTTAITARFLFVFWDNKCRRVSSSRTNSGDGNTFFVVESQERERPESSLSLFHNQRWVRNQVLSIIVMNIVKDVKVREYQWLQIEAKVRQFVHELLNPFQKRLLESSANLVEAKRDLKQLRNEIGVVYKIINDQTDDGGKLSFLKKIDDHFQQIQKQQLSDRNHVAAKFDEIGIKIVEMDSVFERAEQALLGVQESKKQIALQGLQNTRKMVQFKETVQQMIKKNNQQLLNLDSWFRSTANQMEQRFGKVDSKSRDLELQIRKLQSQQKESQERLKDIQRVNTEQKKINRQVDQVLQELKVQVSVVNKCVSRIEDMKVQFAYIHNYLQKYLPLETQVRISQSINSFVKGKERKKYAFFQNKVFTGLNNNVYNDDGQADLDKHIKKVHDDSEDIIKKSLKFINKLRAERKELGLDPDDIDFLEDDDTNQITKMQQKELDVQYVKQIVELQLNSLLNENRQWIKQELELSKLWIKELEEAVDGKLIGVDTNLDILKKQLKKTQIQVQTSKFDFNKLADSSVSLLQEQATRSDRFQDCLKDLLNFNTIINHLLVQEEIDRKAIALFGLKEVSPGLDNNQLSNKNIQLDQKCLSCSGYPASVLSAFKMACLTYKVSPIFIEGKEFSRAQIMQLTARIIQFGKNRLSNKSREKGTLQPLSHRTLEPRSEEPATTKLKNMTKLGFNLRQTLNFRVKRNNKSLNR